MWRKIKKFLKSFTLIELLIVIWILAVFWVMAILTLTYWWWRARDSRQITDVIALRKSLTMYYTQNSDYPVPSKSISIFDQKWKLLWLQWYFDEEIYKVLWNLPRIVKDPSTNNFYTYTRYVNNQWFELWTFLNEPDKYSNLISDKVLWALWWEPYVTTYWIIWYCDNEWKVAFPKPLSLFDFNKKQFITQNNLWPAWKVYLNMNYLRWNGSLEWCSSQITAPVVWVSWSLTWLDIKQASWEEVKVDNDSIKDVLKEVCEHHWLCNAPDIYRISYNYIVLVYRWANWEIIIVEVMLDTTDWKYAPMWTPKQIYDWWDSSPQSGQVYWVIWWKWNSYEIYYGWWWGWLMRYSWWNYSWESYSWWSNPVSSYSWWWKTITGPLNFASYQKVNWSQSVWTYSVLDPVTNKSKWYIISYKQDVWWTVENNVEIPFECRMPKIIYLEQDVYIISYVWEDGGFYIKKVRIGSNWWVSWYEDINVDWEQDEEYNEVEYLQVWDNVFLMKYVDNEWKTILLSMWITWWNATVIDEMILETSPTSNMKMENIWWWYLNVSYMKWTTWINKLVSVTQDWQISLNESKSYNCEEMIISTVDMWQTVWVCSWLTPTFDLMSQSSILSQWSYSGEEEKCGWILPEYAELNWQEKTWKEWQYNTESWECNFKCMDNYYYSDWICKPYSCSVTLTQVNSHDYYVDAMSNWQIIDVISNYKNITNWKAQYKQSFQCNTNTIVPSWAETIVNIVCFNWFIKVWNVCVDQPVNSSCAQILSQNPDSMNWNYWIDTDWGWSNLPIKVYCDMSNWWWTRVQYEDFEIWSTSWWTNNKLTLCGSSWYILWWYWVLWKVNNSKTYELKWVPHTQVKVTWHYMFIDSWDWERWYLYLDWENFFSVSKNFKNSSRNICWRSWRRDIWAVSFNVTKDITSDNITLKWYSDLNQSTTDESWWLDNVAVWVK